MANTFTPSDESRVVDATPTGLFIGGEWRPAAGGATLTVEDPATGKACATSPTPLRRTAWPRWRPRRPRRSRSRPWPRESAARSCAAPTS